MNTRPAFAKAARRHGLFCERLEDRVNPSRSISPTEVLAGVLPDSGPVNVLAPGASAFARLGIDADRITPLGGGMVRIATNGTDPQTLVTQLQATPGIAWAQPNYVYNAATEYTPNDSKFPIQSSLPVTHVPQAWDTLLTAGKPLGNSGTTIAVLDEGVAIHTDLAGAIAANFAEIDNGLDDDGNGYIDDLNGWDFTGAGDNNPAPSTGKNHGTEVSGIIAARTNNLFNIAGIAGGQYDINTETHVAGARILPIRVIDGANVLTSAGLAAGLNYTASRFVRIANISFDLDPFAADSAVQSAMTNLYNAGTLIVASAGNTGTKDAARGAFDQVLFVAGTSNTDKLSQIAVNGVYSSNYGEYVDIAAPSENVVSLQGTSSTTPLGNPAAYGTSLAAPAVAGVAALLLSQNPSYTRDQLAAKILGSAVNIDTLNPGYEGMLGAGRVDALNALTATLPLPTITDFKVNCVSVQDGGTANGISTITLTVPQRLNPASVNPNSFELRSDGPDNLFGTGDDSVVPVTLTSPYRVGATTIALSINGNLTSDRYRFTARSGAGGLRDPFENDFNLGADFTKTFDAAIPSFGPETVANTINTQIDSPATAVLADGSSIVTWAAQGVDGDGWSIVARHYNTLGEPIGAEFLVNQIIAGQQQNPSICTTDDGGCIIAWLRIDAGGNYSIAFRRYNSNLQPVSGEASFSTNTATAVHLARANTNGFYLGYTSNLSGLNSPVVRSYDSANLMILEKQINVVASGTQELNGLASDTSGNFIGLYGRKNNDWNVYMRRFDKSGGPLDADEIAVSIVPGINETAQGIAISAQGDTLAVFQANFDKSSKTSLYGQSFDSSGLTVGGPTLIASDIAFSKYPTLIQDIYTGKTYNGISFVPNSSGPSYLVNVNGTLFFSSYEPARGGELWKSDGTPAGTLIVRDIRPGTSGSNPQNLTAVNGVVYFTASDGINGVELWKSDGTSAGTVLVREIVPGSYSLIIEDLTNVNGTLFFRACDGTNGTELWKSDGSSAGTVMVRDIWTNPGYASFPDELTAVNNTLYFTAEDGVNGRELWKSDGTFSGTMLVRDVNPGLGDGSSALYNCNGILYFCGEGIDQNNELWMSDGTSTGTKLVKDIRTDGFGSFPVGLASIGNTLYFTAIHELSARELWKSDGTSTGTQLVRDLNPGYVQSFISKILVINNTLYFIANGGANGYGIWKSDGTSSGTTLVSSTSGAANLTDVNGTLYFSANQPTTGNELWTTDGTSSGTVLVADLRNGIYSSLPARFTNVSGTLFFSADDGISGTELWKIDGSGASSSGRASVAVTTTGEFTTVWDQYTGTNDSDIYARKLIIANGSSNLLGPAFLLNSNQAPSHSQAAIAANAAGQTSVAFASRHGFLDEIGVADTSAQNQVTTLRFSSDNSSISPSERVVQSVSSLVAGFTTPMRSSSTPNGPFSNGDVNRIANWQLIIDGLDKSSLISTISYPGTPSSNGLYEATLNFSQPILTGNVQLRARDTIQDLNGNALDGDANGTFGGDFVRNFTVANIGVTGSAKVVNTTTAGDQLARAVAAAADGRSIAIWQGSGPGDADGVFGQLFNATNQKIGSEFRINQATADDQGNPRVDMNASGQFVVSWVTTNLTTFVPTLSARAFDANGTPLTNDIQLNTSTAGDRADPYVIMADNGTFSALWTDTDGTSIPRVVSRRFNANGTPASGEVVVASNTKNFVNYSAALAGDSAGNTVAVFAQTNGSNQDLYARLYRADGTPQGGAFLVPTKHDLSETFPDVAMYDQGFVVSWSYYDTNGPTESPRARFFNSAGVPITGEIILGSTLSGRLSAATDDDGDTIFTWADSKAQYRRYNSAGNADDSGPILLPNYPIDLAMTGNGDVRIMTEVQSVDVEPALLVLGSNQQLTTTGIPTQTIIEDNGGSFNLTGVFSDPNNPTPSFTYSIVGNTNPALLSLLFQGPALLFNAAANANGSTVITVRAAIPGGLYVDASFAVIVQPVNDPPSFVKGADQIRVINAVPQTVPNWATGISGGPGEVDAVSFEIICNSNPSLFAKPPAINSTGTLTYATAVSEYGAAVLQVRARDNGGTANGGVDTSPTQTFVITVDPTNPANRQFGADTLVDAHTNSYISNPAIAVGRNGNRVVVWDGTGNGDSQGIFGQLYAGNGTPIGSVFPINQTTAGDQYGPDVAMAADGSFTVVWTNVVSGTDLDAKMRSFSAFGVPTSGELAVHAARTDVQSSPQIAMRADGAFAVVWESGPSSFNGTDPAGQDGSGTGVYARLFQADGTPQTADFRVNTTTTNYQGSPAIDMAENGQFAISFTSYASLNNQNIFAVLFSPAAAALSGEIPVNSTTFQTANSRIALDADGDLAIAWSSSINGHPAVFARRFSSAGIAQGSPVNVFGSYSNANGSFYEVYRPDVAIDADGDSVVSGTGDGFGQIFTYQGYFQRYDRLGNAIGTVTRVNSGQSLTGYNSGVRLAVDADGDLISIWNANNVSSTTDLRVRRHGYPEPTGVTTAPIVNDSDGLIDLGVLFNNNSGPQEALGFSLGAIVNSGSLSKKSISGRTLNVEFDPSVNGSTEVTVRVADTTEGLNGLGTIVIRRLNFASPNAAPILDFIRDRTIDEGGTLSLTASAIDKQGANNLVYSLQKTNPGGTAIGASNGKLTWTSSDNGVVEMTVRVTDPDNTYWTQETFAVIVKNADPTASFSGPAVVLPNGTPTFAFTGMSDVASDLPTLRFAYDYDNNGTWDAGGSTYATALTSSSKTAPGTFFSTAGTTRTVRGRVLDKDGGFTDYFTSVNVENIGGTITPPAAVVTVNTGPQRSNVTKLTVAFDQPVSFPNGLNAAFTLTRAGSAGTVPLNFDLVGNTMTITFVPGVFTSTTVAEPSLNDGNYTFTVVAANVAGNTGPMPSNSVTSFKRLFGDGDGNGTVNADDLALFGNAFGASLSNTNYSAAFDFDANGAINADDFAQFGNRFGVTL